MAVQGRGRTVRRKVAHAIVFGVSATCPYRCPQAGVSNRRAQWRADQPLLPTGFFAGSAFATRLSSPG